ncbi:GTP cyclohydrolase I FolE [Helicobacter sp. MIT 14-3879]|uniref:GTP cyclohydrolase I FolE n=1 Tax=Helicobacter sp. MIT 14-3879 TaxID=2040649 RepID=UPI000E1EFFC0|nr:GTP cyclohydrolase I FolE [Helicobacter sp. MIT 14-3879]RDU64835.1 GTP cyclohydrolase I FolE [Helicobacter sp. MIT 14-3879]
MQNNKNEFNSFFDCFFKYIKEDKNREGLINTPNRVVKSWEKLYSGYNKNPLELLNATLYNENYDEMVVLKNIEFYSMCEHHILPFFGKISIGYIPNSKLVGISHLVELVEIFSKRLQIQERLNEQITSSIWEALKPKGVMVVIEATHLCMIMQGGIEKKNSTIITSSLRGTFKNDARSRAEFMSHINSSY